jgi:electron transfer flavoprotein beta subunit
MPDIMKAKKKPLETIAADSLALELGRRLKPVRYEPSPQRQKGAMVKDTGELVAALKKRGVI